MSIKDWIFGTPSTAPPWPKDENGKAIPPALLTHLSATDMEGQIVITMLESANIPVMTQYPNNGAFGRVVLGFSGTGIDIYVPQTLLTEATDLLASPVKEEAFEEHA